MCRALGDAAGAEHLAHPRQDRRDLVDAGHQPVRDRRDRAGEHDEVDRGVGQPEPQHRGGHPRHRRQALQPRQQRADRGAHHGDLRHQQPQRRRDQQGDAEAEEGPADRGPQDRPDPAVLDGASANSCQTLAGAGILNSSVMAEAHTSCQTSRKTSSATNGGNAVDSARRHHGRVVVVGVSRASRPATAAAASSRTAVAPGRRSARRRPVTAASPGSGGRRSGGSVQAAWLVMT